LFYLPYLLTAQRSTLLARNSIGSVIKGNGVCKEAEHRHIYQILN